MLRLVAISSLVKRSGSPVAGVEVDHPNPPPWNLWLGHDEAGKEVEEAVKIAGEHCRHLDVGRQSHSCEACKRSGMHQNPHPGHLDTIDVTRRLFILHLTTEW